MGVKYVMNRNVYNIIAAFESNGSKMLIVQMNRATCIMSDAEYNRIIIAERKYKQWLRRNGA